MSNFVYPVEVDAQGGADTYVADLVRFASLHLGDEGGVYALLQAIPCDLVAYGPLHPVSRVPRAVISLVQVLCAHQGSLRTCLAAVKILRNVCLGCTTGKEALIAADGAGVLAAVLKVHVSSAEMAVACMDTLRFLCFWSDSRKNAVLAAGVPLTVVQTLGFHAASRAVCNSGASAIAFFALGEETAKAACLEAGSAVALVSLLQQHSRDADICGNAAKALFSLAFDDAQRKQVLVDAGACEALMHILQKSGARFALGHPREAFELIVGKAYTAESAYSACVVV
jgi:hypothetical protein